MKSNKFDDAIADFDKVLAADPNDFEAIAGKGEAIAKKGDPRAGADLLTKAEKLASDPKQRQEIQTKRRAIGIGPLQ